MKIITTAKKLKSYLKKKKSKSVGFVPTMGALHNGHLSLVEMSMMQNDITVVSIFVNPTQFNDKDDLKKYPRNLDQDASLLESVNTTVLFAPSTEEVYPNGMDYKIEVDLKGLDTRLEGEFRPGHFDGVVQVVHRLLEMVKPTNLYMGQKDFQQFSIIGRMIKSLKMKTNLIVHPIIRDKDGLALSSRNKRLTEAKRKWAPLIYLNLLRIKASMETHSVQECIDIATANLSLPLGFKPEYIQVVDGKTLKPITDWKDAKYIVVLAAVWAGNIRLIDNMILKMKKS